MDASVIRPWSLPGSAVRATGAAEPMAELMAGYQAGDARAFRKFHAAMRPALTAYLQSLGTDPDQLDPLLDRVFLAIHGARRSWLPGSAVESWAQAIAGHVWRDDAGRARAAAAARRS